MIVIVSTSEVGPGSYNTDTTNLLSTIPKTIGYKFDISRRMSVSDI
jgi:hypothetical protein